MPRATKSKTPRTSPTTSKPPPYPPRHILCPVPGCPWSFDKPSGLDRHNFTHLTDEEKRRRMFHCTHADCGYMTIQKSNLETHLRTHTGVKSRRCPDCEYATGDPGSLTTHRKKEHGYQPLRKGQSKAKRNNNRGSATAASAAPTPSTAAGNAYPTSIWPSPSSSSGSSPSSAPSSSTASPASVYSGLSMQSQSWGASSTSVSLSFNSESYPSSESSTSGYPPNYAPNYNYLPGYGNGTHPQSQSAYTYSAAAAAAAVPPVYNYTAQVATQPLAMSIAFDCNAYTSSVARPCADDDDDVSVLFDPATGISIPFDACTLAATYVSLTERPGPTLLHPAQKTSLTALHGDAAEAARERADVEACAAVLAEAGHLNLEGCTFTNITTNIAAFAQCRRRAPETELELEGDAVEFHLEPIASAPGGFSLGLEDPASYHVDGELKTNGRMRFSSEWESPSGAI
ncbi:Transcriptional repressor ctcf-like [Mycena venus]|uniref:Transcriptional repressor ctcf-like n=1 Tax=Mycena venus TaxID=2733690 RepID=A0A8H6XKM1_9AGAR|nr:Transcriptional repressor ctcf-like [Mycena venus]